MDIEATRYDLIHDISCDSMKHVLVDIDSAACLPGHGCSGTAFASTVQFGGGLGQPDIRFPQEADVLRADNRFAFKILDAWDVALPCSLIMGIL